MGWDIFGSLEIKVRGKWEYLLDIDTLDLSRNYPIFACLFGVKGTKTLKEIAPYRGLPEDMSKKAKEQWENDKDWACGMTWITWEEMQDTNWDMVIDPDRLHIKLLYKEWQILIDIMRTLWHEYEVRLIVWFGF